MNVPSNKLAVEAALRKNNIQFTEGESATEDGWILEILEDRIEAQAIEDLVRVVDTQQFVNIVVLKNIGMVIGTEGSI